MKRFFILVLVLTLFSCSNRDIERQLDAATAVIDCNSDSAASIISKIDTSSIHNAATLARYYLLKSLAEYKLDAYSGDDSLENAYAFYMNHPEHKHELMIASYLMGDIYNNMQELSTAILLFRQALEIGEEIGNHYYAGLSARGIGYCYRYLLCPADALDMMLKAREHFASAGKEYHDYCVSIPIAGLYVQLRQYDKAETEFLRAISYFTDNFDSGAINQLYESYNAMRVMNHGMSGTVIESYRLLSQKYGIEASSYGSGILAYAYALEGDSDSSLKWLQTSLDTAEGANGIYWSHVWAYRVYNALKKYDKLLIESDEMDESYHSIITSVMSQSVAISHSNLYYSMYTKQYTESQRLTRRTYILYGIMAFLMLLLLLSVLWIFHLINSYHNAKKSILSLSNDLRKSNTDMQILNYQRLRPGKFLLDRICKLHFKEQYDRLGQEDVEFIESVQNNKKAWIDLQKEINDSMHGIIDTFRSELPDFTTDDIKLFSMKISGLSNYTIATFCSINSDNAVTTRLSRMRERIERRDAPHKELFIQLLMSK